MNNTAIPSPTPAPATVADLSSFARAYLETALWSSTDNSTPQGGEPLDRNYSLRDLAPCALARAIADCAAFEEKAGEIISAAIETGEVVCGPDFDAYEHAAHDFWLTRNYHGAGFWDGDWPEPYAKQLTDLARAAGSVDLYVGDDGQIYSA